MLGEPNTLHLLALRLCVGGLSVRALCRLLCTPCRCLLLCCSLPSQAPCVVGRLLGVKRRPFRRQERLLGCQRALYARSRTAMRLFVGSCACCGRLCLRRHTLRFVCSVIQASTLVASLAASLASISRFFASTSAACAASLASVSFLAAAARARRCTSSACACRRRTAAASASLAARAASAS